MVASPSSADIYCDSRHDSTDTAERHALAQNLYVFQRSWEGGGRLFDAFFQQVILCLFLMVLFVGAQQPHAVPTPDTHLGPLKPHPIILDEAVTMSSVLLKDVS